MTQAHDKLFNAASATQYLGRGGHEAQSKRSSQLSEHVAEQLGVPSFRELWIGQALLQHGLLLQDPAFQVACYA